jgi:hypothetical protein
MRAVDYRKSAKVGKAIASCKVYSTTSSLILVGISEKQHRSRSRHHPRKLEEGKTMNGYRDSGLKTGYVVNRDKV